MPAVAPTVDDVRAIAMALLRTRKPSCVSISGTERAGHNGPVELLKWITSEHESVLARFEPSVVSVVTPERWRDPVGAGGSSLSWLAFHTAYHEDVAAALDLDALLRYVRDVHAGTASWLGGLDAATLTTVPDSAAGLAGAGIDEAAVPWLYRMWDAKPASFFARSPSAKASPTPSAVRHGLQVVG